MLPACSAKEIAMKTIETILKDSSWNFAAPVCIFIEINGRKEKITLAEQDLKELKQLIDKQINYVKE